MNEEANSQCEIDNSKACEEDAWDIDLISSQVKYVEKLEQSVVEPVVKREPESDESIGAFMEGSYNGPRALVNSIKQEYISPEDLDDYNKFATEKHKLVIIQEKIENVYDVRKASGKNN